MPGQKEPSPRCAVYGRVPFSHFCVAMYRFHISVLPHRLRRTRPLHVGIVGTGLHHVRKWVKALLQYGSLGDSQQLLETSCCAETGE